MGAISNIDTDSRTRMFQVFIPTFFLANLFLTLSFFYLRWRPDIFNFDAFTAEKVSVAFYFALSLLCVLLSLKKGFLKPVVLSWNACHLMLTLVFAVGEILFWLFPKLAPAALRQSPELMYTEADRKEMVEYLVESPWVKFKPKAVIQLKLTNGADFTHTFETDVFGFKNAAGLANMKKVTALALGDSFVEGMGVSVSNVWTTILSRSGFPTYNLGVQGYSPQQMVGTLEKYGRNFEADFVIFGYTPGFERRALYFLDQGKLRQKKGFTGRGIERFDRYMKEVRRKADYHFKMTNAILDLSKMKLVATLANEKHGEAGAKAASDISRYYQEVESGSHVHFDRSSKEFELTTEAILEVKKIADGMGAKTVILLFSGRRLTYFPRVMNKQPPEDHYELETMKALESFCSTNGIYLITLWPVLRKYVDDLPEPLNLLSLPYFLEDGHLNEVGQRIVAEEVKKYFTKRGVKSLQHY